MLKPVAPAGGTQLGPGGGEPQTPPMSTRAIITVIVGWIVGWSAIGAWRMATRDARTVQMRTQGMSVFSSSQ